MISPSFLDPEDEVTVLGHVFGTPLVVKDKTWLPFAEVVVWIGTALWAGVLQPTRTWGERILIGGLWMPLVLGMEWCHNFAHAAAARLVGKPMDALLINYGSPLCIYHDIEDPKVTPNQHISRALGGPIFNALMLPVVLFLRRWVKPDSLAAQTLKVMFETNLFLSTVAFVPLPALDGGPILKWSLVKQGQTPAEADEIVNRANGVAAIGLAAGARRSFRKGNRFYGFMFAQLALMAFGFAVGLIKEKRQDSPGKTG